MANKEHLDLIKQGVEVWNKWRVKNTDVIPDLSGANLRTPYVTVDQLVEAKTLYKAKLLTKTETELREKYPERYKELIKKPAEPDNETQ